MKKNKKPKKNCEICEGTGEVSEHEHFGNAWGEHGVATWECTCVKRKGEKIKRLL